MKIKFLKLILNFTSVLFLSFAFCGRNVAFADDFGTSSVFNEDIFSDDFYSKTFANEEKPCLVLSYPYI